MQTHQEEDAPKGDINMLDSIFSGVFDSATTSTISVGTFLLCVGTSLVMGLIMALALMYKNNYSKGYIISLALLPAIVCVVIMMVNGNVGTGVAIAGAFSLVRFRSVAGDAKQITLVFLAMGAGLITGMGYIGFGFLYTIVMCIVAMLYTAVTSRRHTEGPEKKLRITVPEDLDYDGAFDDVFEWYTTDCELTNVKTSDMGSLFKLTYDITLKKDVSEKEMIDELRIRNGNLEISISKKDSVALEL